MDSYDDMYHRCAWKDLVRPVRCKEGGLLHPKEMIAGVVVFECPCGHQIQKTQVELQLYIPQDGELVIPCPQSRQS